MSKTLFTGKPHTMVINDIISQVKREFHDFTAAHHALLRGDYSTYLDECEKEITALENAGVEIKNALAQAIGQLNAVQHKLEGFGVKLKDNKPAVEHINHLLNKLSRLEKGIRRSSHISVRQDLAIRDLTKK
jgi:hypothetical protein